MIAPVQYCLIKFIQNDLGNTSYVHLPNILIIQDDFGDTALVMAVNEGHLHVAEILVENGADVNYRNKVRALIPVTQVCIMHILCPMIRHGIMVNQWDVSIKHAAYAVHSRHAYVMVPPFDMTLIKFSLCPSHRLPVFS